MNIRLSRLPWRRHVAGATAAMQSLPSVIRGQANEGAGMLGGGGGCSKGQRAPGPKIQHQQVEKTQHRPAPPSPREQNLPRCPRCLCAPRMRTLPVSLILPTGRISQGARHFAAPAHPFCAPPLWGLGGSRHHQLGSRAGASRTKGSRGPKRGQPGTEHGPKITEIGSRKSLFARSRGQAVG